MLKSDLVARLADRFAFANRRDAERVITTVLDTISKALAAGQRIELRGFGAFSVKQRSSRTGRTPRTGESITVDDKRLPYFRGSKTMKDRLNPGD